MCGGEFMRHFLKHLVASNFAKHLIILSAAGLFMSACTQSTPEPAGSGPVVDPWNWERDQEQDESSVTWNWSCPASLTEGQECQFRYAITSSQTHVFGPSDTYAAAPAPADPDPADPDPADPDPNADKRRQRRQRRSPDVPAV